jgi:hypothetical protein
MPSANPGGHRDEERVNYANGKKKHHVQMHVLMDANIYAQLAQLISYCYYSI